MDHSEMIKQLQEGADPLDLSIKKWEDILNNNSEDMGDMNCALCYTNKNCYTCPIWKATKEKYCADTPYYEWLIHQKTKHVHILGRIKCATCRELAQKELDFLKSLR